MLKLGIGAITRWGSPSVWADAEVVPYAAKVTVWGRWFVLLAGSFLLAYRPSSWYPEDIEHLFPHVSALLLNGIVHYRLLTNRPVTWRWMLALSAMDLVLITANVATAGRFHGFIFLAYYPALGAFAVVFPSFGLGLAWATVAAVAYSVVSLSVGSGLDFDGGDEKALLARVVMMYAMVLGIGLIIRFERIRRQAALERERQLQRERIELSQEIHDTTAQTAYMIGLGIHRARGLADESNEELVAALDATYELSMSAMWELRRPIDMGHIFEGRELGRVLQSHCASFGRITGVPSEMSQSGTEPPLSTETRTRLFSIAHNVLTNAFLHARPGRVEVRLDFETGRIRLSVSDDGVGLPGDYAGRGRGFSGMRMDAERLGGILTAKSGEGEGGTTVTCVVPHEPDEGGG